MLRVLIAATIAASLQAGAWLAFERAAAPPDINHFFNSVSFAPYRGNVAPDKAPDPAIELVEEDLEVVARVARAVRTYSTEGVLGQVPRLARKHNLGVSLGAWLDKNEDRNKREIAQLLELARLNHNVRAVYVGNETLLRADMTVDELIQRIRHVKKRVRVPVTTGEIWSEWIKNPRLANEVDFIAAHILPYWEGIPPHRALEYTIERYEQLRAAFPGKRIVIAEFGWPSRGYNRRDATATPIDQAEVLRSFVREAAQRGIQYNIVEAFDQPWKGTIEGSVGPYWGIFDAERNLKFGFAGTIEARNRGIAAAGIAIGLVITLIGLYGRRPTFGHALLYAVAASAMGAGIASAASYPFSYYLNFGMWVMWGLGCLMMLPLAALTLNKVHEIGEVLLGPEPVKLIRGPLPRRPGGRTPKVSIHVPAYRERPDMMKVTLDHLAKLDYPDYEVLVVVNNTPDEAMWRPVEEHCRALGERFTFLNFQDVKGFKAGALNLALPHMAPDAEIIALIDADYQVHPDWLKDLVPSFEDPKTAFVQAPQDHRDGHESLLKRIMNSEYAGFFDIGMVQRNEANAIIVHGTMLLIRRSAFEEVGGWSSVTIVEDTELGLRLLEAGYEGRYTNRRYGWGLLPDTYMAFKTQRERWAYGAMQIIRNHWRHMLPSARTLSSDQKMHYVLGWACWFSETVGAAAATLNLFWVPFVLFVGVTLPTVALTVPILTAFAVNALHCFLLYHTRVRVGLVATAGAALAAMSLQLVIARAVFLGLLGDKLPFKRTDKGGNAARGKRHDPAKWEAVIGTALALSSIVVYSVNFERIVEWNLFAATLAVQSLPFLSALVMARVEAWHQRRLEARQPAALATVAHEAGD